jgi:uncharacterized membrane protein YsdA (DUF1294 family)
MFAEGHRGYRQVRRSRAASSAEFPVKYHDGMGSAILAYLGFVLVMSVACFVAYGWDKRRSVNGGKRVSERTLQTLAFLGGWPGALVAQRQFRHKTKKVRFLMLFWALVALHVAIVGLIGYILIGRSTRVDAGW